MSIRWPGLIWEDFLEGRSLQLGSSAKGGCGVRLTELLLSAEAARDRVLSTNGLSPGGWGPGTHEPFTHGPQAPVPPLWCQEPPGCKDQNPLAVAQATEGHWPQDCFLHPQSLAGRSTQAREAEGQFSGKRTEPELQKEPTNPVLRLGRGREVLVASLPNTPRSCLHPGQRVRAARLHSDLGGASWPWAGPGGPSAPPMSREDVCWA